MTEAVSETTQPPNTARNDRQLFGILISQEADMPDSQKLAELEMLEAHTNYEAPDLVVADPALSGIEKSKALDDLEQDAWQMANAANEGMEGGEPAALSEVLDAKQALKLPPTRFAYELVLKDLRARSYDTPAMADLRAQTVAALEILQNAVG